MSNPDKDAFPEPIDFVRWVKRSIADLDMRPSNFLVDADVPGSNLRVAYIIKNPNSLKVGAARRLHREIVQEADRRGIDLLPLEGRDEWSGAA